MLSAGYGLSFVTVGGVVYAGTPPMLLSLLLFVIPVILQSWLAAILIRRRLYRAFPLFLAYTVFAVCAEIARRVAQGNDATFFYVYWGTEALYALLGFLAIYEAFHHVFRHFYLMWWWFKFLLPAAGLLLAAISVGEGLFFPPVGVPPTQSTIYVAEMAVRCLQGGVFVLFIGLICFYSMPWQNYAMGIALGFSVSGMGIFITYLALSKYGTKFAPVMQFVPPVAYIVAVVIWFASFVRPEPPDPFAGLTSPLTPEQAAALLRSWTKQIKKVR